MSPEGEFAEALYLLDKHAETVRDHKGERNASSALLKQLAELHGKAGFVVATERNETLTFAFDEQRVRVKVVDERPATALPSKDFKVVPNLRLNRVLGRWEGTQDDTFVVPVPGAPVRLKRSAVAVVVERIIAEMTAGRVAE
jgi:hypothetical protein